MKIYCDNGGLTKELKQLQRDRMVELIMFKYENKNRHIKRSGKPSSATWNDMKNYSWDNVPGRWNDYKVSDKHELIVDIIGRGNTRVDALHLDSAYKAGCDAFITSDKDDIISHRNELEKELGYKIFHISEMKELNAYIASANK